MRHIAAILAGCIMMISMNGVLAEGGSMADLKGLISAREDTDISCDELASILTSFNYSAVVGDDNVIVIADGKALVLVPNGDRPGLCDIDATFLQCGNTGMYEVDRAA
ncbi:MAG TPA: hypothetical protein PKL29_03070 [Methanothrix sp.]|nr:hypothetical protein [Methanothrix sp.]